LPKGASSRWTNSSSKVGKVRYLLEDPEEGAFLRRSATQL